MIIDLDEHPGAAFSADICVVGTGAAGMALASQLFASGRSVIFAESGGMDFDPRIQSLYRSEIAGLCFDGAMIGRTRQFGGSTNCWGGQLLPLDPIDFERRDWVAHSGWPLSLDTLQPYYARCAAFFESDGHNFDSELCDRFGVRNPFDSTRLRYYFSKWSPRPNLRLRFQPHFADSSNVKLLVHATLTRIELNAAHNIVEYLEFANRRQDRVRIEPRLVILCLGGIETARVLLANNHQVRQGLGNTSGHVGRYFQDHPQLQIGTLAPADPEKFDALFGSRELDNRGYTGRFSLPAQRQRELRVLNASGYFHRIHAIVLRRRMVLNLLRRVVSGSPIERETRRQVVNLLRLSLEVLTRKLRKHDAPCAVYVMTEQEPVAESAITLSMRRDRYGVPLSRIDWQLSELTSKTFRAIADTAVEECERSGFGRLQLLPHMNRPSSGWNAFPNESFHHIGATRMARAAEGGVVDPDCRVFGFDNLYVVSSSVFPTSGHSNPTYTIAALAFRLLDTLFGPS